MVFPVRTIGACDFEFDLLTGSDEELCHFMKAFRPRFAENIKFHSRVIAHDEMEYRQPPLPAFDPTLPKQHEIVQSMLLFRRFRLPGKGL